jgi:hypothetical protein
MSLGPAASQEATGAQVDPSWRELWYEPWLGMHPDWLPMLGDDGWAARFATPTPSLRLAYLWFCDRFEIPAHIPLHVDRLTMLPALLPLDAPGLSSAALVIGRVAHVSHCLSTARQGLAHLFSSGSPADAPAWRDALRQAKARPLRPDGMSAPEDGSADAMRRWALRLMASLIDDAVPGAWPRLRLRCDPAMVRPITATPLPTTFSAGLRRQAWRLWRSGVSQESISP